MDNTKSSDNIIEKMSGALMHCIIYIVFSISKPHNCSPVLLY